MAIVNSVACQLEPRPVGWWLYFDADDRAGLLLTSAEEKLAFARDCGIDLMPHELAANWFFDRVSECPRSWYDLATTFPDRSVPF